MTAELEFSPGPLLEDNCSARQATDGTLFWIKYRDESSVYVFHNDRKVEATKCWSGNITGWECFSDALFFLTDERKIYKATFAPPSEIRVEFVRELEEDETHVKRMIASRPKDCGKFAYRLCDDPKGGIRINLEYADIYEGYEDDNLEDLRLEAVYRKKLVYVREHGGVTWARLLTQSIIAIDVADGAFHDGGQCSVFAPEESPLIFIVSDWRELTAVHPITLEERTFGMRYPANERDFQVYSVIGVHDEKITVSGRSGIESRLFTANFTDELRQFHKDAADFAEELKTDEEESDEE